MSIVITNISKPGTKKCRYRLKINALPITEFTHKRSDGLATCLRKAADAVDKRETERLVGIMGTLL